MPTRLVGARGSTSVGGTTVIFAARDRRAVAQERRAEERIEVLRARGTERIASMEVPKRIRRATRRFVAAARRPTSMVIAHRVPRRALEDARVTPTICSR